MEFFTSDLHFFHKNILQFEKDTRNFKDVEEMNEKLIEYWNSIVQPNDTVYNLGDLSFSSKFDDLISIANRLNGEHHLILGNHDQIISNNMDKLLSMTKLDGNPMFSSISPYKEIKHKKKTFVLFHFPIVEWNKCQFGSIHLYGHLHSDEADIKGKALNVGYDMHQRFLTFDDIIELTKDKPIVSHHGKIE